MKNVVLLGSTGSIGESTLRVVETIPSVLRLAGLAANRNYRRVLEQAVRFKVEHVAIADCAMGELCRREAPAGVTVHVGRSGVEELAALEGADVVLCAVVGMAGLRPVMSAIQNGLDIALATKEVLVAAGGIVVEAAAASGVRLLPVDSEHSAIFQCLAGTNQASEQRLGVKRIVLTASGGPFASRPDIDLDEVTVEAALDHPRWDMGRKVTVDSATLMNKGLEIMEARWLFEVPIGEIDVVLHPESVVHSLVEFIDGSLIAQISVPDMRFAIQYALTYPERLDGGLPRLDLAKMGSLHFQEPDIGRFPCLGLAREAARRGATMPAVLNAANEVAVHGFLTGKIPFSGIWRLVEDVMNRHEVANDPDLDAVVAADAWARKVAGETVC